jgi:hypothetical protein
MEIKQALALIQKELKADKNQFNSFGNYKYRSCEDILKALKPLLDKTGTILILNDEVVNIGSRYYVKALATLQSVDKETSICSTAYAREEEIKKGMDGSQITGASSSYARKYALNGLFGIDDTKDSDKTNKGLSGASRPLKTPSTSNFDKAKSVIEKTDDAITLGEAMDKIVTSDKYTDEQKEELVKMINTKLGINEN